MTNKEQLQLNNEKIDRLTALLETKTLPKGDFDVQSVDNGDGTQTLEVVNINGLPLTTAEAIDVALGKTVYLKTEDGLQKVTGTMSALSPEQIDILFTYTPSVLVNTLDTKVSLDFNKSICRYYFMAHNINYIDLYLSENLEEIGEYAFYDTPNMKITGFENTKVTKIGNYAFYQALAGSGKVARSEIDFTALPQTITSLGNGAFENELKEEQSVVIPSGITAFSDYLFYKGSFTKLGYFAPNNIAADKLNTYALYNCAFKGDFVTPPNVTQILNYFNNNTGFRNIVIRDTVTYFGTGVFYADSGKPTTDIPLKNVILLGRVSQINSNPFPRQINQNNGVIYVRDEDVDYYKSHSKMSYYVNIIKPLSELPSNLHPDGKAIITLDANGGQVSTTQVIADGCGIPITLPIPTKAGAIFKGWTGYGCLKTGRGEYYNCTIEDETWTAEWEEA